MHGLCYSVFGHSSVALVVIDGTEKKKEETLVGDDERSLKLTLYGLVVTLYSTRLKFK